MSNAYRPTRLLIDTVFKGVTTPNAFIYTPMLPRVAVAVLMVAGPNPPPRPPEPAVCDCPLGLHPARAIATTASTTAIHW